MRMYPVWILPENVAGVEDEPSLEEWCADCGDLTYHRASYVRNHPRFGKQLIGMLWCRVCCSLHTACIGDIIPPIPDGFHISVDGHVVRQAV